MPIMRAGGLAPVRRVRGGGYQAHWFSAGAVYADWQLGMSCYTPGTANYQNVALYPECDAAMKRALGMVQRGLIELGFGGSWQIAWGRFLATYKLPSGSGPQGISLVALQKMEALLKGKQTFAAAKPLARVGPARRAIGPFPTMTTAPPLIGRAVGQPLLGPVAQAMARGVTLGQAPDDQGSVLVERGTIPRAFRNGIIVGVVLGVVGTAILRAALS